MRACLKWGWRESKEPENKCFLTSLELSRGWRESKERENKCFLTVSWALFRVRAFSCDTDAVQIRWLGTMRHHNQLHINCRGNCNTLVLDTSLNFLSTWIWPPYFNDREMEKKEMNNLSIFVLLKGEQTHQNQVTTQSTLSRLPTPQTTWITLSSARWWTLKFPLAPHYANEVYLLKKKSGILLLLQKRTPA